LAGHDTYRLWQAMGCSSRLRALPMSVHVILFCAHHPRKSAGLYTPRGQSSVS
jgi:hypothetical protein